MLERVHGRVLGGEVEHAGIAHTHVATAHSGIATHGEVSRASTRPKRPPPGATARSASTREAERQQRAAQAEHEQRGGDVGEQHVLGHVRREQVPVADRVQRREQRDGEHHQAGAVGHPVAGADGGGARTRARR